MSATLALQNVSETIQTVCNCYLHTDPVYSERQSYFI